MLSGGLVVQESRILGLLVQDHPMTNGLAIVVCWGGEGAFKSDLRLVARPFSIPCSAHMAIDSQPRDSDEMQEWKNY